MKNCLLIAFLFVSLAAQSQINIIGIVTDLSCNPANGPVDGSIDLAVSGGAAPYTYIWSNGSTNEDQVGLFDDIYTVIVTDNNGDTAEASFTVSEPRIIAIIASVNDLSCNSSSGAADGSIRTNVVGGQGSSSQGFTYEWSTIDGSVLVPGATEQNGLRAGTYYLIVTDANGCTQDATYTIEEPTRMSVIASATDLSCNSLSGPADGSIFVSVTGGQVFSQQDYDFNWSTPDGAGIEQGASNLSGLSAGTYNLTVTDSNGCTVVSSYGLSEPAPVEVTAVISDLTCYNSNTGAINITATGGIGTFTDDYTYNWTSADGSGLDPSAGDQNNLAPGTYTVVVTDNNGCTTQSTFTLDGPDLIAIIASADNPGCGNDNGQINLNVIGGVGDYVFEWTTVNGVITNPAAMSQSNLPAGLYTVTVSDRNGCVQSATYELVVDNLTVELELDFDTLCVNSDRRDLVGGMPEGGVYSGPGVVRDDEFHPEIAGIGTHTIVYSYTDANGCSASSASEITINEALPDVIIEQTVCEDDNPYGSGVFTMTKYINGCPYEEIINLIILPKVPDVITDYTVYESDLPFIWNGMEYFEQGTYSVDKVDENGCSFRDILILRVETTTSTVDVKQLNVNVYPNPAQELVNIVTEYKLNLTVMNRLGQYVVKAQLNAGENKINTADWVNGLYILQFADDENSWSQLLVVEK